MAVNMSGHKLCADQVYEIRRLLALGHRTEEVAQRYGISACTARNIRRRRYWRHLPAADETAINNKLADRIEKLSGIWTMPYRRGFDPALPPPHIAPMVLTGEELEHLHAHLARRAGELAGQIVETAELAAEIANLAREI